MGLRRTLAAFPLLLLAAPGHASWADQTLKFGRFGTVTLYRGTPAPSHVALFVSGDGGWNRGVVDMARELAASDTLVVGIDIRTYLKNLEAGPEKCSYPAADFEALSQFLQKKLDLPRYTVPVLVGYSSGATLVYAVLVQAPTGTFQGALSLGFCPDLPLTKPPCRGRGLTWTRGRKEKGVIFGPAADLASPWVAFQGTIDQVCSPSGAEAFVKQVRGAEIVMLPKVGHGFSVTRNWMPQFRQAYARLLGAGEAPASAESAPADLPLVEVRPGAGAGETLAVIVSGDGGWAGLDRELAQVLAGRGVPVVGLNSLQYFWTRRTPEGAARDLERILRHYLPAWNCRSALLIGYSRGADVLPFMVARLPADLLPHVRLLALLGPAHRVDFEFHLGDWLGGAPPETALPVLPEVRKLKGVTLACFYGAEESDSLCPEIDPGQGTAVRLAGGHHFDGDYAGIASRLLEEALPR